MKEKSRRMLIQLAIGIARLVAGLVAAVVFMVSQSVYSEPFQGCEVRGFLTLHPGCTSWSGFSTGFVVVLLIGIIGGRRIYTGLVGLALVVALAILGGPAAIQAGNHLYVFEDPAGVILSWRWICSPLLWGGVVAYGLLAFVPVIFQHRRNDAGVN